MRIFGVTCPRLTPVPALIIAYDYHPLAVTLFDAFVRPRSTTSGARSRKSESSELLEEDLLWSFIIQISNAMKAVHDRGMAFRTIDASKILLTEKTRHENTILQMPPFELTVSSKIAYKLLCLGRSRHARLAGRCDAPGMSLSVRYSNRLISLCSKKIYNPSAYSCYRSVAGVQTYPITQRLWIILLEPIPQI